MTPRVSVIIPSYHSETTVAGCLNALRAQTWRDFETILVDTSPDELTRQIVTRSYPEVKIVQHPHRLLPHAARNLGVSLAHGELLVFTDADCYPRADWLARLVQAYESGHRVITGSLERQDGSWFQRGVHLCKFVWGLSGLPSRPSWIASTANACYAREVWDRVGPFRGEVFCGDALLSWRARVHGYTPWFEPRAVVVHAPYRGDLRSLWMERLERGEDFAMGRVEFENWARLKAAAFAGALPLAVLTVLVRGTRDALKSGCGWDYLLTLPVSFVGHLAWCLGETRAYWRIAKQPLQSNRMP